MRGEETFPEFVRDYFPRELTEAHPEEVQVHQVRALKLHKGDYTKFGETIAAVVSLLKEHGGYFLAFNALHAPTRGPVRRLQDRRIRRGKNKDETLMYRQQLAVLQFAWACWKAPVREEAYDE